MFLNVKNSNWWFSCNLSFMRRSSGNEGGMDSLFGPSAMWNQCSEYGRRLEKCTRTIVVLSDPDFGTAVTVEVHEIDSFCLEVWLVRLIRATTLRTTEQTLSMFVPVFAKCYYTYTTLHTVLWDEMAYQLVWNWNMVHIATSRRQVRFVFMYPS